MEESSLMSIGEMIDNAFGEADANIVNFKLIQAILYLLARQLRILERKVRVEIEIDRTRSGTKLSVTELKIRATVPKKRKKIVKPGELDKVTEEKKRDQQVIKSSKTKLIAVEKSSSEKSSEKTSSKSTEKSTLDKSAAKKTSDKTFSEQISDKTSSEKTSTDKTISDKTSTDQTSSGKTSTDKTSSDKTSTDKTFSDKTSTDQTSSGKTSTDKTSSDKTSTDKTSSDKTSTDKTSTDKTTSSSRKSTTTKSSEKTTSVESAGKDIQNLLEIFEEQREKELRVIHQRADSRDITENIPTPLASLDSIEEQYEKLLVVERVPADKARVSFGSGKRVPQLSIVTQNQFDALANVVRELQSRLGPVATPDFPDNAQLMQDLRKGASLTDAMAALQLSARLDAAEKTLKQMLELVTDLTVRSGLEVELESKGVPDTMKAREGIPLKQATSKKSVARKQSTKSTSTPAQPLSEKESFHVSVPSLEPSKIDMVTPTSVPGPEETKLVVPLDCITYDDLENALQSLTDGIITTLTGLTTRSNANAENAMKLARRLEQKLESSLNLGNRMNELEILVSEYSDQINILDTSLSSQMTNYQEQLTQMQHDLEAGLESMAEALANTGGDTAAVAELNTHITNLQNDVETANIRQKELKESQNGLSLDLQDLWRQIELLRESKADRDEVADALRDKAGLGALNGLVSLQQFHAVRGDFEKRIGAAYDKFNNQEITWQKAIDDLLRELNDKADFEQLVALRDDINKNLAKLRDRTHAMLEIVGEPRTAAAVRKLFRDAACLSCSSPAHMDLEEANAIPQLPAFSKSTTRPPTIGAEDSSKPAEDGDHNICYPGLPIPHPRDPRAHICQRYCGGSHTMVSDKKSRAPVGMIITPVSRGITTGIGTDGRTYVIEEAGSTGKPCVPCNEQKICTPQPSEADQAPVQEDISSDMTPLDFLPPFYLEAETRESNSMTPPPPNEDF